MGGDQFVVKPGDQVLWYFVDGPLNGGDELELLAPVRVMPGQQFDVTVNRVRLHRRAPSGRGSLGHRWRCSGTTDATGTAHMTLTRLGYRTLRATLDPNIPSAPTKVCVKADLSKCAPARGSRIWGSRRAETIRGTAGPDRIRAGDGNDLIRVRRGWIDRVRCGGGNDTVRAGRRDRIADDCEQVFRRGRR